MITDKESKQKWGNTAKIVSSTNDARTTWHSHMEKKKNLGTDLTFFTKTQKWITDINIKCKTIKLLEDNIGENPDDLRFEDNFSDTTPKT